MKFLVTGGAGFIGSNYMHYVVNKYPEDYFVCLDALTYAGNYNNIKDLENKKNYKFVKGDITNRDFIDNLFKEEKFDIVINFAAESHVDNSIKNPGVFLNTNIIGTQYLPWRTHERACQADLGPWKAGLSGWNNPGRGRLRNLHSKAEQSRRG